MRGTSLLGLFNTVVGCLLNRVLVRVQDVATGKTERYFWAKATDFPRPEVLEEVSDAVHLE